MAKNEDDAESVDNKIGSDKQKDKTKANGWYKIDDVLEYFGGLGLFQFYLIVVGFFVCIMIAWRIIFDLFAAKNVYDWSCTEYGTSVGCRFEEKAMPCSVKSNAELENAHLEGRSGLNIIWEFNNDKDNSIRSTMPVPCSQTWKFSFASSIFFIGALFGVWIFGRISDWIGRKNALMISLGVSMVSGWVIPFFNNIDVYMTCRFFDGTACNAIFLILFIVEVEYVPPRLRNKLGTFYHFVGSITLTTVALWGYLFRTWKIYSIAAAVPTTVILPFLWFLFPESPRYHLSRGEEEKAIQLLQKVAKVNKRKMPKKCRLYEDIDAKTSLFTITKNRLLLRCTLINMFGWFMASLVYYMMWFSAKSLAGSIYINLLILGLVELPGRVAAYFLMDRIGRRATFSGAVGIACIAMFVSIWDNPICRKVMYCIAKALSAMMWAVIYLYSSEMFPTRIRNLGSGIGSAAARVAAFIAPFMGDWIEISPVWPYIAVGVLAVLCCIAFWFVPETTGKDLPQTIGEFENLFHNKNKREDLVIENC